MALQERVFLDKFRISSFDLDKNNRLVYFNLRNIDDSPITDEDETYFFELLNDFGKWELMIELEKAKSYDIESNDYSKVISLDQLSSIRYRNNPDAFSRGGRVYLIWLNEIDDFYRDEICIPDFRQYIIDGLRNLNKWILAKSIRFE